MAAFGDEHLHLGVEVVAVILGRCAAHAAAQRQLLRLIRRRHVCPFLTIVDSKTEALDF